MSGIIVLVLRILLTLVLYAFVAWVLLLIWRDLRQQAAIVSARRIPPLRLAWQCDGKSQTRQFTEHEVTIGRDPNSDCSIQDDTISARHARLAYHHNQWWLEDLASTNGTFLNQEPLDIPTVVVSGDEFRCGQVMLTVIIGDKS